jgi:hypothetical protein
LTSNTVAFLCGRQRKVGAAPHRGNANKPIRKQGKANTAGTQTKAPRRQTKQATPNAVGKQSAEQAKPKPIASAQQQAKKSSPTV